MRISWTDTQHPEIASRRANSTFACEEAVPRANKEAGHSRHLFPITAGCSEMQA